MGAKTTVQVTDATHVRASLTKRQYLCRAGVCGAVMLICIIILVYYSLTYRVHVINNEGWVLYYSHTCPPCIKLRENLKVWTWYAMAKVNCADPRQKCHEAVQSTPTWINKYTGQSWDGVGVYR